MSISEKIFITGINGFIGRNLSDYLLRNNKEIYGLVRNNKHVFSKRINFIIGDLLVPETYKSILDENTTIFHSAAHITFNNDGYNKANLINAEGTRVLLESAYEKKVKKVVHLSACAVLGVSTTKNELIDNLHISICQFAKRQMSF